MEYDIGQASSNDERQSGQGAGHDEDNQTTPTLLGFCEIQKGTCFKLFSWSLDDYRRTAKRENAFPKLELSNVDVTRWKMASRLLERLKRAGFDPWDRDRKVVHQRCKDWPGADQILKPSVALGFSGAALIYGGLHALAWSAHFDSFTEQLLWRMSACVVMGGFPICYIIFIFWHNWDDLVKICDADNYSWFIAMIGPVLAFIYIVAFCLLCLILLAYIPARAYLVVESFINLSHLPAGAYDLPEWSTYFPHFS